MLKSFKDFLAIFVILWLYTSITYIKQPLLEMGQLATKILLESINKNNTITQANLEGELVIQDSTQPVDG